VLITAKTLDGREVAASVPVSVNRTLAFVSSLPGFLSPNGDGRSDSLRVAFTLAAEADVTVTVRAGAAPTTTLLAGHFGPGARSVDWNGQVAGVPAPDGAYETVVEAVTPLGIASQTTKLVVDTVAPVLRLVSAPKRLATLSEPATVTTVVDGRRRVFVRRTAGLFRIPAPSSYRSAWIAARDRAGNAGRPLTVRRPSMRRSVARAATAARPAARRG
jgi:hypothetical protein